MMVLLEGASPVEMLYDQWDLWGHKGAETLLNLNVSLGFMTKTGEHSYKVVEGMEMFVISKHVVYAFLAFSVVLVFCLLARMSGRTAGGAPKGFANFIEPILMFIRDEVVRPNIKDPHHDHGHDHGHDHAGHGHDHGAHAAVAHGPTHKYADKLLPYFCTLFMFLAATNLLGLIPGSSTPTAALTVTGMFAIITLGIYVLGGILLQKPFGIGFFKNLVPACPLYLWPLMFVLEVVGLFTKPFALTVRLFANMTAGHCMLLVLSFMAAGAVEAMGGLGYGIGAITSAASVAIYGLEVFVALLQAYIFTYLSAIFIGLYLVPEH